MSPLVTLLVLGLLFVVVVLLLLWAIASSVGPGLLARRRSARAARGQEAGAAHSPRRDQPVRPVRSGEGREVPASGRSEGREVTAGGRGEGRGAKRSKRGEERVGGEAPGQPPVRAGRVSNDDLRGAKANRPAPRPDVEDAFERFLRSGRDEDR